MGDSRNSPTKLARPPTSLGAVLFDLGGTLVDTRDFEGWSEDGRVLGLDLDPERIARAWEEAKPWVNHREDSPEDLWRVILSRASDSPVSATIARKFADFQSARPIFGVLFSDVERCLERLTRAHKLLGIVSNSRSEADVRGLLESIGIASKFDTIVSSGTEGIRKPDSEIFRRAVARIRVPATATLFVGDDLENDFHGATMAGLHAAWLNRGGMGTANGPAEILSLSEVPRLVRELESSGFVK
jgi:FMN phosphatase YigB (HAD superfamily)